MKDLFRAADDLYQASLNLANAVGRVGVQKVLPETRKALVPLLTALEDYERSRFHRRKIIVEFEAPIPARQISRREMTEMGKSKKLRADISIADGLGRKRDGKKDGEKTKAD